MAELPRLVLWGVVAVVALAYPLAVLAGGGPSFPSREDCARPASADAEIEAVFGRYDSELEAAMVRDRALEVGFTGTEIERDGCGLVKVVLHGIPSLEVGRDFAEQAKGVGFEVSLERAG